MTKLRLLALLAFYFSLTSTVLARVDVAPLPPKKNISTALQKTLEGEANNLSADDLAQVEAAAKRVQQESVRIEKQANEVKN